MCLPGFWPRLQATRPWLPCCGPAPAIWVTTRTLSRRRSMCSRRSTRPPLAKSSCRAPLATMRTFAGRRSGCSALSPNTLISTCWPAAQDSDEGIRSAVVGTLGSHGTEPAAIDLLLNLLDDPSPQVRISALSSLGFLQQPRTLRKVRLLANDDNPRVRAWVAIALGHFSAVEPTDPATSSVLDRLAADADPYVRDQATEARQRKPLRGTTSGPGEDSGSASP